MALRLMALRPWTHALRPWTHALRPWTHEARLMRPDSRRTVRIGQHGQCGSVNTDITARSQETAIWPETCAAILNVTFVDQGRREYVLPDPWVMRLNPLWPELAKRPVQEPRAEHPSQVPYQIGRVPGKTVINGS